MAEFLNSMSTIIGPSINLLHNIAEGFKFNIDRYPSILILIGPLINLLLPFIAEGCLFNFDCYLSVFHSHPSIINLLSYIIVEGIYS